MLPSSAIIEDEETIQEETFAMYLDNLYSLGSHCINHHNKRGTPV